MCRVGRGTLSNGVDGWRVALCELHHPRPQPRIQRWLSWAHGSYAPHSKAQRNNTTQRRAGQGRAGKGSVRVPCLETWYCCHRGRRWTLASNARRRCSGCTAPAAPLDPRSQGCTSTSAAVDLRGSQSWPRGCTCQPAGRVVHHQCNRVKPRPCGQAAAPCTCTCTSVHLGTHATARQLTSGTAWYTSVRLRLAT